MSTWKVEPLADEHRDGVIGLFAEIFGATKAGYLRERFDWQYRDNPARRPGQVTNWVMLDDGKVVGHFGFIPVDLKLGDALYHCCWGIDLMIHPAHRGGKSRLTLFQKLDKGADLPIAYGMADVVNQIFTRRGYIHRGIGSHLIRFTTLSGAWRLTCRREIPPGRWNRMRANLGWKLRNLRQFLSSHARPTAAELAGWNAEIRTEPPPEMDAFWQAVSRDYPVATLRTDAVLRWRYCNARAPGRFLVLRREGRLRAVLALEAFVWSGIRVGHIAELVMPRKEVASLLPIALHFASEALARQGVDALLCEGFPSDIRAQFERAGFSEVVPGRTEHQIVYDPERKLPQDLIGPADNWLLTGGDCDRSTPYPRLAWVI